MVCLDGAPEIEQSDVEILLQKRFLKGGADVYIKYRSGYAQLVTFTTLVDSDNPPALLFLPDSNLQKLFNQMWELGFRPDKGGV